MSSILLHLQYKYSQVTGPVKDNFFHLEIPKAKVRKNLKTNLLQGRTKGPINCYEAKFGIWISSPVRDLWYRRSMEPALGIGGTERGKTGRSEKNN